MPRILPDKKELKTLPADTGTRLLNGVRTFGGSLIGDAIAGVSPSLASTLQTYTGGLISTTPQSMLEANREGWTNRAFSVGEAVSSQAVGAMIGPAINKVAPLIKKGVQQIPKVFPKKFQPNPEAYYRVIGDEAGLLDAQTSNLLRPNQQGAFTNRATYYTKGLINDKANPVVGGGVHKGTYYKGNYVAEVSPGKQFPQVAESLNPNWNFGLTKPGAHIATNSPNVRLLKKDWLRGYKDITPKIPERKIGFDVDTKPVTEVTRTTLPNGTELRKNPKGYLGGSTIAQITSPKTDGHISLTTYKPTVTQALFQKGTSVNPLRKYYYFTSAMPNKIEAARSFATLMDFVPKGGKILEPFSLSSDSYLNLLKQSASPRFKASINGQVNLNAVGTNNPFRFPNEQGIGNPVFTNPKADITPALEEINTLLKKFNIPGSASIKQFPDMRLITAPNIQLKKLYKEGGLF